MNKYYIIILLSLVCYASHAQDRPRNSYKAGLTTIFFGTGDMRGLNFFNEYNHALSSHITIAPSLQVGYGFTDGGAKGSAAADLNFFFSPMRFEQSKVRIGIGPSVRFVADPRGFTSNQDRSNHYFTAGFTMVLEGEFNVTSRLLVGVGGSIQPYASGEIVSKFGLNTGYKF